MDPAGEAYAVSDLRQAVDSTWPDDDLTTGQLFRAYQEETPI